MNPVIIVVGTVAVLSLATLLVRVLKRSKNHPAGPDNAAVHPLNTAGVAPASGTNIPELPPINPLPPIQPQIAPKPVEAPSDMPAHHPPPPANVMQPPITPPAAPEFEAAPVANAPAPVPQAAQPNSLLDGLPQMHKPGDVFHPENSDQKPN